MIISLFSVFDPTSYFILSLNWIVFLMIFMFIPIKYYVISRENFLVFKNISFRLESIFREVSYPYYKGLVFLCVGTFIYLVIINLIGLFPFVFTVTVHPIFNLGVGIIIWFSFFIIGWYNKFIIRAAHLVPEGSPLILAPLIVIIERISHLIRPFTLSVRLAANIIAGHLIIGLISKISIIGYTYIWISVFFQNILILLEIGVAIIQGFVFRILLLLYSLEYY